MRDPALNALLPAGVVVEFPNYGADGYDEGRPRNALGQPRVSPHARRQTYYSTWATLVTLADCGLERYAGFPGQHHILDHDNAYVQLDGAARDPVNRSLLRALAVQLATDYYQERLHALEEVYPGVRRWDPEPTHDVLWSYQGGWAATRALPTPWNAAAPEFFHQTTPPAVSWPTPFGYGDTDTYRLSYALCVEDLAQGEVFHTPDPSVFFDYLNHLSLRALGVQFGSGEPLSWGSVGLVLDDTVLGVSRDCFRLSCPDGAGGTLLPASLTADLTWTNAAAACFAGDTTVALTRVTDRLWVGTGALTCTPPGYAAFDLAVEVRLEAFYRYTPFHLAAAFGGFLVHVIFRNPFAGQAPLRLTLLSSQFQCDDPVYATALSSSSWYQTYGFNTDFGPLTGCNNNLLVTITE